jgi:hypothetical protein
LMLTLRNQTRRWWCACQLFLRRQTPERDWRAVVKTQFPLSSYQDWSIGQSHLNLEEYELLGGSGLKNWTFFWPLTDLIELRLQVALAQFGLRYLLDGQSAWVREATLKRDERNHYPDT